MVGEPQQEAAAEEEEQLADVRLLQDIPQEDLVELVELVYLIQLQDHLLLTPEVAVVELIIQEQQGQPLLVELVELVFQEQVLLQLVQQIMELLTEVAVVEVMVKHQHQTVHHQVMADQVLLF